MPTADIDPATCPLCGTNNQCVITQGGATADCWCMQADVSADALARIPTSLRNRACLCSRCASGTDTKNPVLTFDPDQWSST